MRVEKRVVLEDDDIAMMNRLKEKINFIFQNEDTDFYGDGVLEDLLYNLNSLLEL